MSHNKYSILLVEDDINLSYLLSENLRNLGYDLCISNSGSEGIKIMDEREFDLYILDLMLPDINGFELAKHIKKRYISKPFLFLTAVKTEQEKFTGYELGAEDYITKPFTVKELHFRIQVILRRHEKTIEEKTIEEATLIEKADMILDTRVRKVTIQDESFKLTKRESELLKIFMTQDNDYIDRTKILLLLWERSDIYTSRSMDVYIARLRKIISKSKFLSIENLYGLGHRLTEKK